VHTSWSSAQVRAAEEPLLAARVPLMARAAFALAGVVRRELVGRRGAVRGARVVLLVGPGNNGGDALHAGALLARSGAAVVAVVTAARVHPAGLAALRTAAGRAVALGGVHGDLPPVGLDEAAELAAAGDVVLDGLLGIGSSGGGVRGEAGRLVEVLADRLARPRAPEPDDRRPSQVPPAAPPCVVAVDVPSGVGVDDGTTGAAVLPADVTVTFGVPKPALLLPPAAWAAGRVELVDIGLEPQGTPAVVRLEDDDAAALWPVPGPEAHKYTRGVLGVVAGTRRYPGAAVLTSTAAVLAGVGMVRYVGDVGPEVVAARPEVVVGEGRVQAWVLGPGVDPDDAGQRRRVDAALVGVRDRGEPAAVDAGALRRLPDRVGPHVVLTPHAGELALLLTARGEPVERAQVEAEPLRWARAAHDLTGATVLLKGGVTVVVGAHGAVFAQAEAPSWLATAGSGDVLAGVLGALLAGRADDVHAEPSLAAALAATAALVHGRAGERANPGGPVAALDVARALPATVADLLR